MDKGSVSRRWMAGSATRLREIVERPLTGLNLAAVLMDAIRFSFFHVAAPGVSTRAQHILRL